MRIFLDTNVLASALATRGLCHELLERVMYQHTLLIGEAVLPELRQTLNHKFHLPPELVNGFQELLQSKGELALNGPLPALDFEDHDDLPILACALQAKADVFVTGDNALLELDHIETTPIISPRQCWLRLFKSVSIHEP